MTDEPGQMPTQQEMEAGAEVVAAGQAAADAEPDPSKRRGAAAKAIQQDAKSKGWDLTPEQADMLAGVIAEKLAAQIGELPDKTTERIREAGGFDRLPEPLAPATPPTGAGSIPAEPPGAPDTVPDSAPGGERSRGLGGFAGWFRSQ